MAWGWLLSPAHGCLSVCHLFRECSNIVERKGLCLTQALSQALRRSCGGAAPVIHPHFRFPPAFLFPRLQCDCLPFLVVLAHPVANSLALWLAGVEATLGRHFANKDKPQITLSLSSGGREAFWPSALIFLHFGPGPQPEPFFFSWISCITCVSQGSRRCILCVSQNKKCVSHDVHAAHYLHLWFAAGRRHVSRQQVDSRWQLIQDFVAANTRQNVPFP
jgi:hypothetical protein